MIIVVKQNTRTAIHNIGHPPLSGVPALVLHGASPGVCRCGLLPVTQGRIEAGGTFVHFAALVAMRPTVVSREWFVRCSRVGRPTRSWRSTCHPLTRSCHSRRIHQLLVCGSQRGNGVCQRQVGLRELLQHGGVVGHHERQVVKCGLQADKRCRWIRMKHTVHSPEWLPSPRGQNLTLLLEVGGAERLFPCRSRACM